MTHDWLLVETLGIEPAVVAQGRRTKNLVPISAFLRRSPNLMAIQTAISETVRTRQSLSTITPRNDRVIRTEAVQMSDGRVHGVQVWIGPPDVEPPERPVAGPLKWDLTAGVATDTRESLYNSGRDPSTEATEGRAFAEDLPQRDLNPGETKVLSMVVKAEPGETLCTTWNLTDHNGESISVGFVVRAIEETQDDGSERLICRAMNWRAEREGDPLPARQLGPTNPQWARPTRGASRRDRSGQLETAEVARRARAVHRLACERVRGAISQSGGCSSHGENGSRIRQWCDKRCITHPVDRRRMDAGVHDN